VTPARNEGAPGWVPVAVVAIGLLVLAVGLAVVLLDDEPRAVEPASRSFAATLVVPPFARACESQVEIPARAGRLGLVVSSGGKQGPPLAIEIERAGRVVTTGRHPGGYVDSPVSVRLRDVLGEVRDGRVCITNDGPVRIALLGAPLEREASTLGWIDEAGAPAGPPATVTLAGRRLRNEPERIHFEWQFQEEASPLSLADDVSDRFALVKASFFGTAALWVALALTALASAVALVVAVRAGTRG
jgi:hypothetical protein